MLNGLRNQIEKENKDGTARGKKKKRKTAEKSD